MPWNVPGHGLHTVLESGTIVTNGGRLGVLGISGSLRTKSFNSGALRAARDLAPDGMSIDIADISGIPLYDGDVEAEGMPEAVLRLRAQIAAADGLLIVTPEYNYSIPGVLKNAIDWASRPPDQPFDGKPMAIMGASRGGGGTTRCQYHLRQAFIFLNGLIMNRPELMISGARALFDDDVNLTDEGTRERIGALLIAFAGWIRARQNGG